MSKKQRPQTFAKQYAGHPALKADAVYALPLAVIAAIEKHIPKFWTSGEIAFEKDLTENTGHGLFLNQPFGFRWLAATNPIAVHPAKVPLLEQQEKNDQELRRLITSYVVDTGRDQMAAEALFARQEVFAQRTTERQRGYIGWLVTEPHFRSDVLQFRKDWHARIKNNGHCPAVPRSMTGIEPPVHEEDRNFHTDYMTLYEKWGIEGLATFELPVPMQPQLLQPNLFPLESVSDAGLSCFIPWYLMADQQLKLRDLADHFRGAGAADHLDGWLNGSSRWGHVRYGQMFELYAYNELALKARYGDRLENHVEKLDRVYASAISLNSGKLENRAESIRKIRRQLRRRLDECEKAGVGSAAVSRS